MPAYLVSEFVVANDADSEGYTSLASVSVAQHGGRYVVQGASPVVPEGEWPSGHRVSILEFPTMECLMAWYKSSEYALALAARTPTMSRRLLIVEGASKSPES